ncbi:cytochrome c oxidase assembly factor 4 homolog, mitochondrial [Mobula hypostoma]|uniref:cytochrome c oxidase assembly factor 4 homolog, mitochondrial n=1 Tax=Mobula hypostoma TaxID=723540 RepID=UPI002FC2BBB9
MTPDLLFSGVFPVPGELLFGRHREVGEELRVPGSGGMSFHDRGRRRAAGQEEEEEDPVDQMISRTGCASYHHAVQDCMAEHQDWRRCQGPVQAFKQCMADHQRERVSPRVPRQPKPATT